MTWDEELSPEQKIAAAHTGNHARLLAGPGTGKTRTLTCHICFLVSEQGESPESILALTFTRAAARELRQRVKEKLREEQSPRICTLHSFALRQLLRNAARITDLPQPLRIADDWEERHIILEDLKEILGLHRIDDVKDRLKWLSADWQSLTADNEDWEGSFRDPSFLGAWQEHRQIYGYTLRDELVYQLKKALEQRGDFELEGQIKHLLVDEYQDLNRCDLSIVNKLASRNIELYIAGDDDQSIYGFRKAHPAGIRMFPAEYPGAEELSLVTCKRCDTKILNIGLSVARQDPRRIPKEIIHEPDREQGEVEILRFDDQESEASGIAKLCKHLINCHELTPSNILILLRSDRYGAFSRPIRKRLQKADIPVSEAMKNPLNEQEGRAFLAFLRLTVTKEDSLAWRTLFNVWCGRLGSGSIRAIYDLARRHGTSFAETVLSIQAGDIVLPSTYQNRISSAIQDILFQLNDLFAEDSQNEYETCDDLMDVIRRAAESLIEKEDVRDSIMMELEYAAESFQPTSVKELVRAMEVASDNIEQDCEEGKVNILTMHKAKGLTAKAVIVAAVEDQYIPGKNQGDALDDERRLLYVSLTRAKHHLFITYCDKRTGQQQRTGRDTERPTRSLSRFLIHSPYTPKAGRAFINRLTEEHE